MHWTISRLKDYESCPARYKFAYLEKGDLPRAPMPAAERGTQIHDSIDQYLQGKSEELHPQISPIWRIQIEQLRTYHKATPEQMWEHAEGWWPLDPDEPLWLRGKIDAYYWTHEPSEICVIDFKTGKPYLSNEEQLELYAVMAFARFDGVDTVYTALWYLDSSEPHEKTFKRDQAAKLARKWEGRARPLLTAKSFPYHAGKHCGWCPFRQGCPQAPQNAGKLVGEALS